MILIPAIAATAAVLAGVMKVRHGIIAVTFYKMRNAEDAAAVMGLPYSDFSAARYEEHAKQHRNHALMALLCELAWVAVFCLAL